MKFCILFCSCLFLLTSCDKDDSLQVQDKDIILNDIQKRSCGMHDHMKNLLADPEYKRLHEARLEQAELAAASGATRTLCSTPVVLPVAVHYQGVANPDVACLRALAQTQVAILNNDYHGTNTDISTWINTASSSFPGVNYGETCVEFCIATQNHPTGYGITNGDPAVTINTTTGDNDPKWAGYINIFVQPNTGILGYSPLGGSGNGDGVVVDAAAFGSGNGCTGVVPNPPYNLGRTLTHELGHYLLLDHIWGGGCGSDDGVGDTPDSKEPYYGCPSIGQSTCSSTDMHMNYMDYTNDACMYMFSSGQSTKMENYFNGNLQNVINNAANVCGSGATPTCTDGIQNGNETGVDCGGDCPPCVTPTCTDGIQNGNETGVDCGGDCPPCVTPTCTDGIQNGNETGIDCGGDCPPCSTGNIDIKVLRIIRPFSEMCNTSFKPIVRVVNKSPETLTSFTLKYGIVGGQTLTQSWTGSLAQNKNVRLVLPTIIVGNGAMTFFAETENPNGQADSKPANDRMEKSITVDGNQLIKISIKPDDYASEITWKIFDDNNNVVSSAGPWQDGDRRRKNRNVCLTEGCYTFTIYDSYGDGICCDYGNGNYNIRDFDGNVIAQSDGQYGFSEDQTICVTSANYTYEGSRRQEVVEPVSIESGDYIKINNTRVGSQIIVTDNDGNVLDRVDVKEANKSKLIDKSDYSNKQIKVKIVDKKGKLK